MTALKQIALLGLLLSALSACADGNTTPSPSEVSRLADLGIEVCIPPDAPAPPVLAKPGGTSFLFPKAPAYPYPQGAAARTALTSYADCVSEGLTTYIKAWSEGRVPARLPASLVPWGTNLERHPIFTLRDPAQMRGEDQFALRPAGPIEDDRLWGSFPDPNATYLVLPAMLAPFGSHMVIEGDFPRSRYFSIQVTPPFDLNAYHYDGGIGIGEVPMVDVDVPPVSGAVNPFRIGASRNAASRAYRVRIDMAKGDPVALNPAFRPPNFRSTATRRFGSGLLFQGPWGHPKSTGHKRGLFEPGQLWLRYYAPDRGTGPLAGVGMPKVTFRLADGTPFFIEPDLTQFNREVQTRVSLGRDSFAAPEAQKLMGPDWGWTKQAGIFRSIIGGIALGTGGAGRDFVQDMGRGVAGRDDSLMGPSSYEQSATSATHIDYLVRGMALERNHVVVLTGKLPTFPDTRGGAALMPSGQMRYWSLTGYHQPQGFEFLSALTGGQPIGLAVHSVMDDELTLDSQRNYVIALSRDTERPANATPDAGVTWVDWGASGEVSWTLRWMSVGPEWKAPITPDPRRLGDRGDYWSDRFDPRAISQNSHNGALGPYLPRIHYMTLAEFEALGPRVRPDDLPPWR